MGIMSSESKFINAELKVCPYANICKIPHYHISCRIPICRVCPEYITRREKSGQ